MSVILNFVKQCVPMNWKAQPSGWTSGNCPMCVQNGENADTRGRGGFYFEEEKFQYNCFNCGFKTGWSPGRNIAGRLRQLLITFGVDEADIQRVNLELLREEELQNLHRRTVERTQAVNIDWPDLALPPNAKSILHLVSIDEKTELALQYIVSRRLESLADWHYSNSGHYKNRIILPFTYKGRTVGFTARWIGKTPNKETPKYYNQQPKDFVFNLDAQKQHSTVIVTEGPFDALVTGGVAIGSNACSTTQANIIDNLDRTVVVLPDADSAGQKMVDTAVSRGWSVAFPPWEGCKDAVDALEKYGRLFTVRSILDSVESNPLKIQVLAKQYCKDDQ